MYHAYANKINILKYVRKSNKTNFKTTHMRSDSFFLSVNSRIPTLYAFRKQKSIAGRKCSFFSHDIYSEFLCYSFKPEKLSLYNLQEWKEFFYFKNNTHFSRINFHSLHNNNICLRFYSTKNGKYL